MFTKSMIRMNTTLDGFCEIERRAEDIIENRACSKLGPFTLYLRQQVVVVV